MIERYDTLPLFTPPAARRSDPDTSHDAAESMKSAAATQRSLVLYALFTTGTNGFTADEVDRMYGWDAATANRRFHELRKAGLIHRTARKRPTHTGREAYVHLHKRFAE